MTYAGLAFMLISVGAVASLLAWCLVRVLGDKKPRDHFAHVEPVGEDDLEKR
ncbi:MAG: hypothetical protein ACO3ND_08570 [Opitutales bacterium]